jgi:formiminoglutamate deiminase
MPDGFFFEHALLPSGWARDVRAEVSGDRFSSVAAGSAPRPGDRHERIAAPGLPNVHSHAFQRAMIGLTQTRGPSEDSFWTWREAMYGFLARLGPEDVEAVASYAYMDMLEAGFTDVGEFHYLHRRPDGGLYDAPAELAFRHVAAADAVGIGLVLMPSFYAHGGFGAAAPSPGQRRFVTDLDLFARILHDADAAARRSGHRCGVAPHSLRAVSPDQLEKLSALAAGRPLHIHAAEQVREVEECLAWSGLRPVAWLLEHTPVGQGWCVVHATHMDEAETARLARSGAVAGLCPLTEADLGDGLFPAEAYAEAGGHYAVGTDSNVCADAALELRLLEYGQRLWHRRRNVMAGAARASTGAALLAAAVDGGARALGRPSGGIQAGARADFVALDAGRHELSGLTPEQALDAWTFSLGRKAVHCVCAAGRVVVNGGRHAKREEIGRQYELTRKTLLEG